MANPTDGDIESEPELDLRQIDLNLLRSLHHLLVHASVTRAAAAMGLSQPAMTQALARIRDVFGDPILVRTRSAMAPTELGDRLRPRVAMILGDIGELLRPQSFDLTTVKFTVRVEMDDACQFLLLPALLTRLACEAPGVHVLTRPPSAEPPLGLLESRQLHLSIGSDRNFVGEFRRRHLLADQLAYVVRADAAVPEEDPLAAYLALDHISVTPSPAVSRLAEEALAQAGHQRRVVAWVPTFLVASTLVEHLAAALTLPAKVADRLAATGNFLARRFPIATKPLVTVAVWHGASDHDPAQRWFRDLLAEVARTI
jgi:LysR family transcriptional regulator, mexEF-oprN operon transcriptional activator